MEYAGVIDSEETMSGILKDGRRIYVHMLTAFLRAPEHYRNDPQHWLERLQNGDFDDPENPPSVWVEMAQAEQDMQALDAALHKLREESIDPREIDDEPCAGCENGCDQCLDPLMAGYEGCYHKDSEKCNCAEEYRLHQKWIYEAEPTEAEMVQVFES